MLEEIVKIAADLASRTGFQSYFEPGDLRRDSRSQNVLQFTRRLQVLLHALFALRQLFVETGVLNRTRNLRGQQRKRPHMIFREETELCALEIHDANHAILQNQRDGYFRPHILVRGDVARIGQYIGDTHGLARMHGRADYAFPKLDIFHADALVVALAETVPQ